MLNRGDRPFFETVIVTIFLFFEAIAGLLVFGILLFVLWVVMTGTLPGLGQGPTVHLW